MTIPWARDRVDEIRARASGRRLAVFLDYDGTLTPIVLDVDGPGGRRDAGAAAAAAVAQAARSGAGSPPSRAS